jgi:hypothetical protein
MNDWIVSSQWTTKISSNKSTGLFIRPIVTGSRHGFIETNSSVSPNMPHLYGFLCTPVSVVAQNEIFLVWNGDSNESLMQGKELSFIEH